MFLQDELTSNIVTMTSQTLYGTMTMANSAFYWASSFTPSVSESWSKVGAFVFGTEDETSTPGRMSDSARAEAASYYYNAIDTIILLVTIWIYFKTFSLVWRSISAIYQTTVGVIKILKFFASKLGFLANGSSPFGFFRNETPQQNDQDASAGDGKTSTTIDPHAKARATAMTQTNSDPNATLQGYPFPSPGQQTFMQSQLRQIPPPPPPPIEYLWYYHNQMARNGMHGHWVPPTPPFAPLPNGANVDRRNVFAARNSDFVVIPARRPPVDGQTQENENSNNSNVMNDTNSRLANVQDPLPPQPASASNETSNNGNQTANDAAMSIAGGTSIAKESKAVKESNTGHPMPTDSNGNEANAATARAANNNDDDASEGTTGANSKKRKSPFEESDSDDDGMDSDDDDSSMHSTEPTEKECSPTKKQRREDAGAMDVVWANQSTREKILALSNCDPDTPEDMIQHLEVNAKRNDDMDEEEEEMSES